MTSKYKHTPIAKWWCAISVNHNACVCGWKPPRKVKIAVPAPSDVPKMWLPVSGLAAYAPQLPVKNGVRPSGCGAL